MCFTGSLSYCLDLVPFYLFWIRGIFGPKNDPGMALFAGSHFDCHTIILT